MSKPTDTNRNTSTRGDVRRRIQNALFSRLYRSGGRLYDPLTWFLFGGAWDRWRSSIVQFVPMGRILDVGCGTGKLVQELQSKGYVAFGLDRELSMLRRSKALAEATSKIVRGDASALPFQTGTFDACVSTFPSRFIVQRSTLDEVSRVLRPGGTFAIVLSGYTDDWPLRRKPIQLALRLFYGRRDDQRFRSNDLFQHPELTGEWHWLSRGPDHVLAWVGVRAKYE